MATSSKNKQKMVMRKMCPNYEREDTLETVLEVPIPEEMFAAMGSNGAQRWQSMAAWTKAQTADKWSSPLIVGRYNEMSFILSIVGCPILPFQIQVDRSIERAVKHASIVRTNTILHFLLPFFFHGDIYIYMNEQNK